MHQFGVLLPLQNLDGLQRGLGCDAAKASIYLSLKV
jgi:hypothetical protein